MNKEYMEVNKTVRMLNSIIEKNLHKNHYIDIGIEIAINHIKQQVAPDVEPVIRCRDCKHFKIDVFKQKVCMREFNHFKSSENDFCSRAERKK